MVRPRTVEQNPVVDMDPSVRDPRAALCEDVQRSWWLTMRRRGPSARADRRITSTASL